MESVIYERKNRKLSLPLISVIYAIFVSAFSIVAGQFEYGSYDLSALIDTSWRIHSGQIPIRDFPCLLPPTFYLLGSAALTLFGSRWWAFSAMNVLCFLCLIALGWHALRSIRDRDYADRLLFAQTLALSVPVLVTNHLWHSTITQMLVVTLFLLTTTLWCQAEADEKPRVALRVSLIFIVGMLCEAKPNIAAPALTAFLILPLIIPRHRRLFFFHVLVVITGAIWSSALLLSLSISPRQTLEQYRLVSGRPKAYVLLEQVPVYLFHKGLYLSLADASIAYVVVAALVFAALWLLMRERRSLPAWAPLLALAGACVSVSGFCTNLDNRSNDLAPSVFCVLLLLTCCRQFRVGRIAGYILIALVLLCSFSLGATRYRMKAVGAWAGEAFGPLSYRSDSFFGTFEGRDRFWQVIAGADEAVHAHPGAKIFFGTRLEFEYVRLGMRSEPGLPAWWHPGSSFPISMDPQITKAWHDASFGLVVMATRGDGGYDQVPQGILGELRSKYRMISDPESAVDVYIRK